MVWEQGHDVVGGQISARSPIRPYRSRVVRHPLLVVAGDSPERRGELSVLVAALLGMLDRSAFSKSHTERCSLEERTPQAHVADRGQSIHSITTVHR